MLGTSRPGTMHDHMIYIYIGTVESMRLININKLMNSMSIT